MSLLNTYVLGLLFVVLCCKYSMTACPSGTGLPAEVYNNDTCYIIVRTPKYWLDSCKYCHTLGGELVIIDTPEKQTFISQFIKDTTSYSSNFLYIGGYSDGKVFRWMNGKTINDGTTYWLTGKKFSGVGKTTMAIGVGTSRGALGAWYYNNIDVASGSICQVTSDKGPFTCPKPGTSAGGVLHYNHVVMYLMILTTTYTIMNT